jgi:hypothetical protein
MSEKKKQNPYGVFGEVSYISTDPDKDKTDPYEKEEPLMSRYTGSNMKTNPPKRGRHNDALFSGRKNGNQKSEEPVEDPYVKPGAIDPKKLEEHKKKMKSIADRDFRYVSPPQRAVGLGNLYGTIQGLKDSYKHEPEYKVRAKDEVPERPKKQKPNILTRPACKGTYGMVGQFFSLPATEMDKEGKPITNNYDAQRIKEREEWNKEQEVLSKINPKSFKSTCRPISFFDEQGNSGVSKVYAYPRPDEKDGEGEEKKGKKKESEDKKEGEGERKKPFMYSSPPKRGWNGTLSKFPNTTIVDEKADAEKREKDKVKQKFKAIKGYVGDGEWKPVSGGKQGLTKSLLRRFY